MPICRRRADPRFQRLTKLRPGDALCAKSAYDVSWRDYPAAAASGQNQKPVAHV
jgi:hypothetical protein